MQRSLVVLLLGIAIGLIAALLYWHGTQQRSKFLFDQNVKCQQVARQYETENRVAVLRVTYSPSRNSCVAEVTRPPQNGSIDFTVNDLLSGELLFVGHCTLGEFLDKSNEKFKALSKDQDSKFAYFTQ